VLRILLPSEHNNFNNSSNTEKTTYLILFSETTDLFLLTLEKGKVSLRQIPGKENFNLNSLVLAKFSAMEKVVS